jgi:hypothetical protein
MERDWEEDLDTGRRIILKLILKKYDGVVWTGFIWLRLGTGGGGALVSTVMNLWVPSNVGKFLGSCTTGDFSRTTQLHGDSWLVKSFVHIVTINWK